MKKLYAGIGVGAAVIGLGVGLYYKFRKPEIKEEAVEKDEILEAAKAKASKDKQQEKEMDKVIEKIIKEREKIVGTVEVVGEEVKVVVEDGVKVEVCGKQDMEIPHGGDVPVNSKFLRKGKKAKKDDIMSRINRDPIIANEWKIKTRHKKSTLAVIVGEKVGYGYRTANPIIH